MGEDRPAGFGGLLIGISVIVALSYALCGSADLSSLFAWLASSAADRMADALQSAAEVLRQMA